MRHITPRFFLSGTSIAPRKGLGNRIKMGTGPTESNQRNQRSKERGVFSTSLAKFLHLNEKTLRSSGEFKGLRPQVKTALRWPAFSAATRAF